MRPFCGHLLSWRSRFCNFQQGQTALRHPKFVWFLPKEFWKCKLNFLFKKCVFQLKSSISTLLLILPEEIREGIKMCLNQTPELRPDAIQFTKVSYNFNKIRNCNFQLSYFEHPLVKTLNSLDTRSAMDETQKMQFFKDLPAILPQFPLRVQLQKVYPHLAGEYGTPMLVPFIL